MTGGPPVVGFAGMSHLGLVSAAGAAEKGFTVIGFDPDADRVAGLRAGRLPLVEPGLDELCARNRERLTFTDTADRLADCDLVFVSRDVPTDSRGESDLGPIGALLSAIERGLREDAVLTVLCQVPPGFTRMIDRDPARLCYLVETLVFGEAVRRTLHPERFIVGLADGGAALPGPLAAFLAAYDCPILPMRYESAELAKISINLFLAASVTTTNSVAELCEKVGAYWSEIVPALRLDRRIGQYAYLGAGLGISGGNIERDLATMGALADRFGTDAGAIRSYAANSRHRKGWPLRILARTVLGVVEEPRIAVLGLAYKANSDSVKNSPALSLLDSLRGVEVSAFDPLVTPEAGWHPALRPAASAEDALLDADAVAVMTPWDAFAALTPETLRGAMRGGVVVDPFRILDGDALRAAGFRYHCLGADPARPS